MGYQNRPPSTYVRLGTLSRRKTIIVARVVGSRGRSGDFDSASGRSRPGSDSLRKRAGSVPETTISVTEQDSKPFIYRLVFISRPFSRRFLVPLQARRPSQSLAANLHYFLALAGPTTFGSLATTELEY